MGNALLVRAFLFCVCGDTAGYAGCRDVNPYDGVRSWVTFQRCIFRFNGAMIHGTGLYMPNLLDRNIRSRQMVFPVLMA